MSRIVGNIELYMGPKQLGAPDDLRKVIVGFIDKAQSSLRIAVQELDSRAIANAIVRAKQRGVQVQLVVEADYLREAKPKKDPFTDGGEHEANRRLQNAILRVAVVVHADFNPDIFHQKFIVRDNQSLLTGSANFTDTDASVNLNHVVIVHDAEVARSYGREFDEIRQGHFGRLNEGHDVTPPEVLVSNVRVKPLFAPDHNPEMEIMKQIAKAKKRVDFAIFTFASSSGIDDQMVLAKNAGVKVRGALFTSQANQVWSASETLANAGIRFRLVPRAGLPEPAPRKLHHKLMVIDRQVVIVGSFNYTHPANFLNDENILVIGDMDSTDADSVSKQKLLAGFALEEIDRMIAAFA